MAVPNTPSLLEINNPQLTQSADSLESALAQFSKLAASIDQPNVAAPVLPNGGRGFDEWLASDLQYGALLSGDETSLTSSPYSAPEESPVLEYEMMNSGAVPSLFESFPSAQHISYGSQVVSAAQGHGFGPVEQVASLGLTTHKLQQAAAALNIPWSHELQKAVLAHAGKLPVVVSTTQVGSPSQHSVSNVVKTKSTTKRSRSPEEEEPEEVLAKRAKNTDAARRSRLKKMAKLDGLEVKVAELEATNHRLNTRVAVLETEKNGFLIKEAEQNARIAQLEAKVMEAHLTLKTRTS